MRLTSFGHCTQITFFPNVFPVNCYLVKETHGACLIDAALPSSASEIEQAIRKLRLPITHILLTHGHSDHVGALDRLHAAFPDAAVLISERDGRLLSGDVTTDADEPQGRIRGGIKPCQTKPTAYLKEGDRIGNLEVIRCPGHTPGHMGFLDHRDGTLLAGDAFQVRGGVAVAGTLRPFFPFPALATWDKPTALKSAKRLLSIGPSHLAVGHGNVLTNPAAAMSAAIERAEQDLRGTV